MKPDTVKKSGSGILNGFVIRWRATTRRSRTKGMGIS